MKNTEDILIYQPILKSVALKIVGSIEDAEDIVQDTFEKWFAIDRKDIKNTKAYLIRSVRNNSIKFLTSLRNKISQKTFTLEEHFEIVDKQQIKAFLNFDMDAQLGEAWHMLHKKLEPLEKSIYVMREVFSVEYEELQEIFDKKKDHCRQLFFRAKTKLEQDKVKFKADFTVPKFPLSFKKACEFGSFNEMIDELKREVSKKSLL
ncbi:MAG: RNA polymerase subunit sigma [Flammeovirgaceae bacterium]|nr:RNA polymerase subunit sigma [Flammeovirgaceae bacterium]|tara:strand:+ start:1278 stop:1892 length:615 start_codon:yes stop_codon:yes gene_type:complete